MKSGEVDLGKITNVVDTTWAIIGTYWQNEGETKPRSIFAPVLVSGPHTPRLNVSPLYHIFIEVAVGVYSLCINEFKQVFIKDCQRKFLKTFIFD